MRTIPVKTLTDRYFEFVEEVASGANVRPKRAAGGVIFASITDAIDPALTESIVAFLATFAEFDFLSEEHRSQAKIAEIVGVSRASVAVFAQQRFRT